MSKINIIEQQIDKNKNNLDKVNKLTIKVNSENLLKKLIIIPILTKYTVFNTDGGGLIIGG